MNRHEVLTHKEPSLIHLKFFGCDAFVHVPMGKRSKMDNEAKKCISIRYKDGVKGYQLWSSGNKENNLYSGCDLQGSWDRF